MQAKATVLAEWWSGGLVRKKKASVRASLKMEKGDRTGAPTQRDQEAKQCLAMGRVQRR